jgi:Zn-dependent protease with chaperone function
MDWSGVMGLLAVGASFAAAWLLTRLGVALAIRRFLKTDGQHWVERARLTMSARQVVGENLVVIPLAFGAIVAFQVAPWLGLSPRGWGAFSAIAAMVAVLEVGRGLERRIGALAHPDRGPLRGPTPAMLLVAPTLLTLFLMIGLMPERWGWGAMAVLMLGVALTTGQILAGWIVPLRWLGLARPASPRVRAIVERASATTGIRPRSIDEVDSTNANAFAFVVPRSVAFLGPILDDLDDDELATVAAHELGHLNEPWPVYLIRVFTAYLPVACGATMPLTGSFGLIGTVPCGLMLAALIVLQRVAPKMEERSDRIGREQQGEAEGTYARALESIYRSGFIPAVLAGKPTVHPHLYDRLVAAGLTPDYPRPLPPPRAFLAIVPALGLMGVAGWAVFTGLDRGPRDARALSVRADQLLIAGQVEPASRLYRQAANLDPERPHYSANLSQSLLSLGRLEEAEGALIESEAALGRWESTTEGRHETARIDQFRFLFATIRNSIRQARSGPAPGLPPGVPEPAPPGP